jgi:predicted RNase H-like HicB family nuclease
LEAAGFDVIRRDTMISMVDLAQPDRPQLMIELIADPEQGGFTARMPDIPAYGEGETEEQAIADLQEALKGYIETFGLEDANSRLVAPQLRFVTWDLKGLTRA